MNWSLRNVWLIQSVLIAIASVLISISSSYGFEVFTLALEEQKIGQQSTPNQEPFPEPKPELTPPASPESPPIVPAPTPTSPTIPSEIDPSISIPISKIEVIGSTVFGPDELDPIIKPLEGSTVTSEQLRDVTEKITKLYIDKGYLNSRAVPIDPQQVTDGIVRIQIIEGGLEDIIIEGTQRLNNYVRSRIELGAGTPLNINKLEDRLRLLKADPLLENIEASIRAGKEQGQSILALRVTEANPFRGNLSVDNYSPPSIGSERLGLRLAYGNLTGLGDEISASYSPRAQTLDTYNLEFAYRVPLNAMNGTLEVKALIDRNEIIEGRFEDLDIRGEYEQYEINYRQPLIRTPRQELALSFGFDGTVRLLLSLAQPLEKMSENLGRASRAV